MSTPENDPLADAIAEPKSATVDGQTVTNRDVREIIEAERHAERKKAAKRPSFGIALVRMRPGGPV